MAATSRHVFADTWSPYRDANSARSSNIFEASLPYSAIASRAKFSSASLPPSINRKLTQGLIVMQRQHRGSWRKQQRLADWPILNKIWGMSLSLSDDEIHGLIAYARVKFADERYPFASALRPVREALAKLDPKPVPQPPAPKKPYVPSLVLQRKNNRRR
jgi:hypothetical protein